LERKATRPLHIKTPNFVTTCTHVGRPESPSFSYLAIGQRHSSKPIFGVILRRLQVAFSSKIILILF
jgi:hypothetical protein